VEPGFELTLLGKLGSPLSAPINGDAQPQPKLAAAQHLTDYFR
jgi:hypothetical protein